MGPNKRLVPVGTGLLLGVGAHRFLITAAHVLDANEAGETDYCDLATYGQGETVVLNGESFRTAVPKGKTRFANRLDIGFLRLDDASAKQIGEDRFLSPANCDLDDTGRKHALYGALGYPACLKAVLVLAVGAGSTLAGLTLMDDGVACWPTWDMPLGISAIFRLLQTHPRMPHLTNSVYRSQPYPVGEYSQFWKWPIRTNL